MGYESGSHLERAREYAVAAQLFADWAVASRGMTFIAWCMQHRDEALSDAAVAKREEEQDVVEGES